MTSGSSIHPNVVQKYLDRMVEQRDALFSQLHGIVDELVWMRPAPATWSIGEDLDHLRIINTSMLRFFRLAWALQSSIAEILRARPYRVDIDNVYKRPGFPLNVGWLWPPRYTPARPVPLAVLCTNLVDIHQEVDAFYRDKDPDLLGHVGIPDPVIGWLNLIQCLRVGLYHDELHYDSIRTALTELPHIRS
jgi:hypothetical protein